MDNHTTTIVILHPVSVTKEYLLGQDPGFSNSGTFLSAAVVRHALFCLVGREVKKFDDGLYHADIHTFGMADLLNNLSVADAVTQLQRIPTKPDSNKQIFVYAGVRWEVSSAPKVCRIFGPKSDPDNRLIIDLRKETPHE